MNELKRIIALGLLLTFCAGCAGPLQNQGHDQSPITILESGTAKWNIWRQNNPDIVPDFHNRQFSMNDLRGADFHGANLKGATFQESDCRGARFDGAKLTAVDFQKADLEGINLSGLTLHCAKFYRANLQGANLQKASLRGASLAETNLKGADCRNADLRRAAFRGTDFLGADLSGADLRGADFFHAILDNVNLQGANLKGADFNGATLAGANLKGASFGPRDLGTAVSLYMAEFDSSALAYIKSNRPKQLATYWDNVKKGWVTDDSLLKEIEKPGWHGWNKDPTRIITSPTAPW